MKLITKEIQEAFKKQGDTSEKSMKDILIVCKFFSPIGAATWWLYEDLGDGIYMAFVTLGDPIDAECGTVSLEEIQNVRLPLGLKIERDMHFPILKTTLKEVYDKVKGE